MTNFLIRRRLWIAGLLAIAAIAAIAWPARERTEAPAPLHELVIAGSMSTATTLHLIANELGYWAQEGLSVRFVETIHGKAAFEKLLAGQVDLAYAADPPLVINALSGLSAQAIAAIFSSATYAKVVGRRDRGIESASDLSGKRVGVTVGTATDYFLWAYMLRNRLPPQSVHMVDISPGQMQAALKDGDVDAAVLRAPYLQLVQIAQGGNAATLPATDIYAMTMWATARPAWLREHPELVERYLRVMLRAEKFNREFPEESQRIAASRIHLPSDQLPNDDWRGHRYAANLLQSQLLNLEATARWAQERGLAGGKEVNLLESLYLDGMLKVAPDNVTVVR